MIQKSLHFTGYFIAISLLLNACGIISFHEHQHEWCPATCIDPMQCASCDETTGEPLGHYWIDATCLSPRICNQCGAVDGEPIEHTWRSATCTEAECCEYCGKKNLYSTPLGHVWIPATLETPATCSRCRLTNGDPMALDTFDRGQCNQWGPRPSSSQYIGLTGYVSVTHLPFLYSSQSDSPYENDWFDTPWYATTYQKDKQFYVPSGIIEHKTPVVVLDVDLTASNLGAYHFDGFLLVEEVDNPGNPVYISVTDFVTSPYWESSDISSLEYSNPVLAVYHQRSDYWPVDRYNQKADIPDGCVVLILGDPSWGHIDETTHQLECLTEYGRCFLNLSDLTPIY